jgi:hypothetical protein
VCIFRGWPRRTHRDFRVDFPRQLVIRPDTPQPACRCPKSGLLQSTLQLRSRRSRACLGLDGALHLMCRTGKLPLTFSVCRMPVPLRRPPVRDTAYKARQVKTARLRPPVETANVFPLVHNSPLRPFCDATAYPGHCTASTCIPQPNNAMTMAMCMRVVRELLSREEEKPLCYTGRMLSLGHGLRLLFRRYVKGC